MPPLHLFSRKWNIATDDFVYISFLEIILQFVLIIIFLLQMNVKELLINCKISIFYKITHLTLGGIMLCQMGVVVSLMIFSGRGSIMETEKRARVPLCLYCKFLLLICEIVLSFSGFSLIFHQKSISESDCYKQILATNQILFISFLSVFAIHGIQFLIFFDKMGHKILEITDVDLIQRRRIWKAKLKCLLCTYKPSYQEENALSVAANIFSKFTEQLNLVFSDYVAGIQIMCFQDENMDYFKNITLKLERNILQLSCGDNTVDDNNQYVFEPVPHLYQTPDESLLTNIKNQSLSDVVEDLSFRSKYSLSKSCGSRDNLDREENANMTHLLGMRESSFYQNQELETDNHKSNSQTDLLDWRDFRFIYYFATMAKASYGWPLHILFRDENKSRLKICFGLCCTHSMSCFCSDCVFCKHESSMNDPLVVYSKESFCSCHKKAILNETLLQKENLVCVSFYNKTYHSPFFVAICHEMETIVLSVRGTFSLHDVLTDIDATLVGFDGNDLIGCQAHSGMAAAALNLRKTLNEINVIQKLKLEFQNYRLIFTGHSLGAGIAIILSCLYYSEYPSLKCYAFGPPLGVVNIKMADYCKDFVLTVVNGYEWVPRTSLQSLNVAKKRIIQCLYSCKYPKFQLTARRFFKCGCLNFSIKNSKWNILNVFQRDCKFWENSELNTKLPGQIVHIIKIKAILDPVTLNFRKSETSFLLPIITASEQFNTILFHPKMFQDHFPHKIVNRLYKISMRNKLVFPNCHHFLKHYWPEGSSGDKMKLPFLGSTDRETSLFFKKSKSKDDHFVRTLSGTQIYFNRKDEPVEKVDGI